MVKARLKIDFNYYEAIDDLEEFISVWAYRGVLCSVDDDMLVFGAGLRLFV